MPEIEAENGGGKSFRIALQISQLKEDLSRARDLSQVDLAAEVRDIGFSCLDCGDCCRGEDNSVLVFPREIRAIQEASRLSWSEVAAPPQEGEWDHEGCFHTLEWRLAKMGDACRFYQKKACSIYPLRPLLCQTYPFYLDRGKLICSECPGLGGKIDVQDSQRLAEILIIRQITEIEEAIALLERYRDFSRGLPGKGGIVVHDSEGEHRIEVMAPERQS
ncbi:MAG TPA: YkgJ family cysteine cluster protein [Methanothrix sp.]|nr:YkgJ family cysteine cluster protein [Methanothrix sp.]